MFTLPIAVMLFSAPCADVASCQKQCDSKKGASCVALARLGTEDTRHALYSKACDLGSGEGCRLAAFSFLYELNGQKKDLLKSVPFFERGCAAKDAMSCHALGESYAMGIGTEPNGARAAQLHEKACDLGELQGCASAGVIWDDGKGVKIDKAKAQALFKRACTKEIVTGCYGLASSIAELGDEKSLARALPLMKQACEGGIATACADVGARAMKGVGMKADRAESIVWSRKACDADSAIGCSNLAAALLAGKTAPEMKDAFVAYQKACDQNYVNACNAVGVLQLEAKSPVRDPVAGAKRLKAECAAGNKPACSNLEAFCKAGEQAACP